jgi:hypothetical protein
MATRKRQKVSRRQVMLVLGAGVIGGATQLTQAQTRGRGTSAPAPQADPCVKTLIHAHGQFTAPDGKQRNFAYADPCCVEGLNALRVGYNNLTGTAKDKIKPFFDDLDSSKPLLEYSLFAFGLTAGQIEQFHSIVVKK